jgi:integrase
MKTVAEKSQKVKAQKGDPVEIRKGVWRYRLSLPLDPLTNKHPQKTVTITAANITEARKHRNKAAAELEAQKHLPKSARTFESLLREWLRSRANVGREAKTLKGYEDIVDKVAPVIGHVKLATIAADGRDIFDRYYASLTERGLTPNTVGHYHSVIRAACNYGIGKGILPPLAFLKHTERPSVGRPKVIVPTVDDVRALMAASEEHHAKEWPFFLFLAVHLWARRSEIIALRWDRIDLQNRSIFIDSAVETTKGRPTLKDVKSHQNRRLSIDQATADRVTAFREWQAEASTTSAFVFPSVRGVTLHPDTVTDWFDQTRRRAGVHGPRLHDIRHFGPTQALSAGMPINQVSYRLGHAKISTTLDLYIDYLPAKDMDLADYMAQLMHSEQ